MKDNSNRQKFTEQEYDHIVRKTVEFFLSGTQVTFNRERQLEILDLPEEKRFEAILNDPQQTLEFISFLLRQQKMFVFHPEVVQLRHSDN